MGHRVLCSAFRRYRLRRAVKRDRLPTPTPLAAWLRDTRYSPAMASSVASAEACAFDEDCLAVGINSQAKHTGEKFPAAPAGTGTVALTLHDQALYVCCGGLEQAAMHEQQTQPHQQHLNPFVKARSVALP